jgi:hypothetical protein
MGTRGVTRCCARPAPFLGSGGALASRTAERPINAHKATHTKRAGGAILRHSQIVKEFRAVSSVMDHGRIDTVRPALL